MWNAFSFDNAVSLNIQGYVNPRSLRTMVLDSGDFKTDRQGEVGKQVLLAPNQIKSYGRISFESRFKDDRGKNIAGTASAEVFYSDFQIGIRKKKWAYEAKEEIEPEVIVVDQMEQPVVGQKVTLQLVHRKYKSVRVRGSGNYFSYQTRTTDQVIDTCEMLSAKEPSGCILKAKAAGSHYILVEAKDSKQRLARSSAHLYVTGSDYVGWYRENHDRIDIIPDKNSYKVGETISLLVKNPYESVDAIITLERFGILKQFRKHLDQGAELVHIPLDDKDYAPGFNLSVHLIKGRVSEKLEGGVDLGKPSFKMGLIKVEVVDPDTVLNVTSQSDRQEYQPGETVKVSVQVDSTAGLQATELSIAIVDERILQLAGAYEGKYKLHDKFYNWNLGDVQTTQMLTHLIGRRHFGKKGAPEGGDGDGAGIRKNFLPLAYWNPSLVTDASGKAEFSFTTPDNLTGWKILIVAVDKKHRFGFGGSSFKTAKKLMLEPALPSFITEGDTLNTRFAVFNRTGNDGDVTGKMKLQGATLKSQEEVTIPVADQEKGLMEWTLKAPFEGKEAVMTVTAKTKGGQDGALYKLPIRPYLSFETFATYDSTTKGKVTVPLKIPDGIRTDVGGMELIVSSSLISHLDEAFEYSFSYPYVCWEQTMVRALMLNNYLMLEDYLSEVEPEREAREWIQELLAKMPKFQASNGGMSFWKSDVRTVDAYLSTFTAMGLIWLERNNQPIPQEPARKLYQYVRNILSGKISMKPYSKRTRATVLAMATYVVTLLGDDSTAYINKSYEEKDFLSLFGKSFLWMASTEKDKTKSIAKALKSEIFSHADLTSGSIQFQEVADDGFQRILHSTTRTNCNLLTALLKDNPGSPFVQPLVSLDHWHAQSWAMEQYSGKFILHERFVGLRQNL